MKKHLTLLFAAAALFCIPAFSQVYTTDLAVDSLEGLTLELLYNKAANLMTRMKLKISFVLPNAIISTRDITLANMLRIIC